LNIGKGEGWWGEGELVPLFLLGYTQMQQTSIFWALSTAAVASREVRERELMQRLDGSVGRSDEVRIEYFYYDVDTKGELEVLKHPQYHPHFRERAFSHMYTCTC